MKGKSRTKYNKSEYEHLYKEADKTFTVNTDQDLRKITISLPTPPPIHLIDGYGSHPDDQYFRPLDIPRKLIHLEKEAYNNCQDIYKKHTTQAFTWDKILDEYWRIFEDRRDDMPEEVKFIKNVYYFREYGYWFFNDGRPTYIPPDYFDYLNYWKMPDVRERKGLPEYRDKDRRKYLARHYFETATETFAELDEDGFAVKNKDGRYEMIDVGARVFYGDIEAKVRRSGATHQGTHKVKKGVEKTFGGYGTIVSMDGDNATKHYYKKLIPAKERYPFFLMARDTSTVGRPPGKLRYTTAIASYDFEPLDSYVDYTDSAGERKNDGDKLFYSIFDEEGKALRINVLERWNVNKLAQSTGGGSNIIGYCTHPSTVEEMDEGGLTYMKMAELSDFYHRIRGKGQTHSGLSLLYFSGVDGLENFIDRFGMSVVNKPTKRQRELSPDALFSKLNMGAYEYLMQERESLLKKGTTEALESYRSLRRKMPIYYAECWLGTSGNMGWNLEKVDQRLIELKRINNVVRGDFDWEGGIPDSRVVFTPNENGKFEVSKILPKELSNRKTKERVYVGKKRMWEFHHAPLFPERFTMGVDPIRYANKTEAKQRDNKNRESDFGLAVFWERDRDIDPEDDKTKWKSYKFIVRARYRTSDTFECNEDALKVAVYYGCTVYPETNVENLWEHFINRGYGGYLQYDIDMQTGKPKDRPGVYMGSGNSDKKDELFRCWKDYIENRAHAEDFAFSLRELKKVKGVEDMTHNDDFTARGIALLGSKSKANSFLYESPSSQTVHGGVGIRSAIRSLTRG